jgi:hypothetical protein
MLCRHQASLGVQTAAAVLNVAPPPEEWWARSPSLSARRLRRCDAALSMGGQGYLEIGVESDPGVASFFDSA